MGVQVVECTNCGGDALLGIVGLVVALGAAILAGWALKVTKDTLALTRDEVGRSSFSTPSSYGSCRHARDSR